MEGLDQGDSIQQLFSKLAMNLVLSHVPCQNRHEPMQLKGFKELIFQTYKKL